MSDNAETIELQGTRYFLLDDEGNVSEVDAEPLPEEAGEIDYAALMEGLDSEHVRFLRSVDADRLPDDPTLRFFQVHDAPDSPDAWAKLIERLDEEAKDVDE